MKDEINEILDRLKYIVFNEIIDYGEELSLNECKLLLNYITNLQQQLHQASLDIQELTERDIECPSWCDKLTNLQQEIKHISKVRDEIIEKYNDLQQENETRQQDINNLTYQLAKMKEENDRLKDNAIHNDKVVDKARWNEMIYKSRCEKAVDKLYCYGEIFDSKILQQFQKEMENILEGENNGN